MIVTALKDGELQLKKQHDYYHQIQAQMYFSSCEQCKLVVWTPSDLQILNIEKDPQWIENIAKLVEFYFSHYIVSM